MKRRILTATLWVLMLTCLSAFSAGCVVESLAWWMNVMRQPEKVPAVFEPPEGKKFLVFVDDISNPIGYEPVKAELTRQLNSRLTDHKIAASVVPYEDMLTLMAAMSDFNRQYVVDIGKKLGAELVLYVHIDEFRLKETEMSPMWTGHMRTTVRVVDVEEGLKEGRPRLWPKDRDAGYPVDPIKMPETPHPSPNYGRQLSRILAEKMADRITELLYDHTISAEEADKRDTKKKKSLF